MFVLMSFAIIRPYFSCILYKGVSNMVQMNVEYQGDLHCKLEHGPSDAVIYTDAPVDNHGRGEEFSPTDLATVSLGACAATIMGIAAKRHNIPLEGMKVHVTKEMVTEPVRRIGRIGLTFHIPYNAPDEHRKLLENAARTCPVHQSLHPDVEKSMTFVYAD
jgi:putative redox protein